MLGWVGGLLGLGGSGSQWSPRQALLASSSGRFSSVSPGQRRERASACGGLDQWLPEGFLLQSFEGFHLFLWVTS